MARRRTGGGDAQERGLAVGGAGEAADGGARRGGSRRRGVQGRRRSVKSGGAGRVRASWGEERGKKVVRWGVGSGLEGD